MRGEREEIFLEHKRILELEDTLERINLYTNLETSLLSGGGHEKQRKEWRKRTGVDGRGDKEDRHCFLCVALAEMVGARPSWAWYSQLF